MRAQKINRRVGAAVIGLNGGRFSQLLAGQLPITPAQAFRYACLLNAHPEAAVAAAVADNLRVIGVGVELEVRRVFVGEDPAPKRSEPAAGEEADAAEPPAT